MLAPTNGSCAAVVIPAFGQPGLLGESLASALGQSELCRVVVVIDGCPMAETYDVVACFSRANPGRVFAIRRPNGGLSAARNTGIDFVLSSWPDVEAVMFLDADNRIGVDFMARAVLALREAPREVGWVYPDVDMIGLDESSSMSGEFSRFALLDWNYCDAGSVARRELFERGLRFDETMRLGFEDWDFWLQAVGAGYVGRHLPNAGFGYRRRGESMFAQAWRRRDVIVDAMNRKRRDVLRPKNLLALEAAEAPRFALIFSDGARLASDPVAPAVGLTLAETAALLLEVRAAPGAGHFPPYLCFTSQAALTLLAEWLIAASIFWLAQVRLRKVARARLFLRPTALRELRFTEAVGPGDLADDEAAAIFGDWNATRGNTYTPTADLIVDLPTKRSAAQPGAARAAEETFAAALRACPAPPRRDWRRDVRPARNRLLEVYRRICGVGAIAPMLPPQESRGEIGFVIPVHSFGGVEKVVTSQARVLRRMGFRPHLFVTGGCSVLMTPMTAESFVSIHLAMDPRLDRASRGYEYFGAAMSGLERDGGDEDALGLLCLMDVVLDTHSLGAHGLAARLRALGVMTLTGLHLVDRDAFGAPVGNPHMALAYEHAYDGFVVISQDLRRWCLAHGVPEAKIVLAPNSPSYPARAPNPRTARREGPLRALCLGRLDAQKGLDRLAAIVAATRGEAVEWRIVGKPVLDENLGAAPDLGVAVEPPVHAPEDLDALYDWADVLVLASRFEGAPLTILEARRRGVVIVATRVGAVEEVIGAGGYLVDGLEAALIAEFVRRLFELARDPGLLTERARATLADPPPETEETMGALVTFIEKRRAASLTQGGWALNVAS